MRVGTEMSRRRSGFTLVEMLVVIAIIGILVALLLPAVQSAREAARSAACVNNLRQMGIAFHSYASANRDTLPPGGVTNGVCCSAPSFTNWAIEILPFIEEQAIHDRYDFDEPNEALGDSDGDGRDNSFVRVQQIQVYKCPSDRDTDVLLRPSSGPGQSSEWARGSYRAVTGRGPINSSQQLYWDSHEGVKDHPLLMGPAPTIADFSIAVGRVSPAFVEMALTSPVKLRKITDGMSQTLLIGERHSIISDPGADCGDVLLDSVRRQSLWAYSYTSYNKSQITPLSGTILPDTCRCALTTGDGEACKRGWGSLHPGGLHFVRCDASTHFISDSTDMTVLSQLATIRGGEVAYVD